MWFKEGHNKQGIPEGHYPKHRSLREDGIFWLILNGSHEVTRIKDELEIMWAMLWNLHFSLSAMGSLEDLKQELDFRKMALPEIT